MIGLRYLFAFVCAATAGACESTAATCETLPSLADGRADAAGALNDCLKRVSPGGRLELRPGTYRLREPVVVDRSVRISTRGIGTDAPGCAELTAGGCATLLLDPRRGSAELPLTIRANGVSLSHLVVRGAGQVKRLRDSCKKPELRPGGGLIRVTGSGFQMRKSVLRDATCYTALEITSSAQGPVIENNQIGPNGDHRPGEIWADGVTIHDSANAIVRGNDFVDNTDVQLILGGCRDCRVESNRFRHGGTHAGGSFAELMLHSWPNTSGDFTGSVVSGNWIDCGPALRCGFGLMIGAAPWYQGRMAGGTVRGNSVRHARIAINVDGLTGPVTIEGNVAGASGGRHASECGTRSWPAVNVAPGSRGLVRGDPSNLAEGSVGTAKCLLNR